MTLVRLLASLGLFLTLACSESNFAGNSGDGGGATKQQPPKPSDDATLGTKAPGAPDNGVDNTKDEAPVSDKDKDNDEDEDEDDDQDDDDASGGSAPDNPTVVSAGSFTVWAEPPNPGPLQAYRIYIEVKLTGDVAAYKASDLSGKLSGTDGFRQSIPDGKRNDTTTAPPAEFSVKGKRALLSVEVPGAFLPSTRDTIEIKSKLLGESQSLVVVFR